MKAHGSKQSSLKIFIRNRDWGIIFALIIFLVVVGINNPGFSQVGNLLNVLREASFIGVIGIGMTLCITAGLIDLSVGSIVSLISGIIILACNNLGPMGILIGLVISIILGLISGMLIIFARIPSFIATLATMLVYRSASYILLDSKPMQFGEKWFTFFGNGDLGMIPIPFIILLVCTVIGVLILTKTSFGMHIVAIGNSQRACKVAGIKTRRVILGIYALVGLFTGIGALMICSRLWMATPGMKEGLEFEIITAVVLGGTALVGGKGDVINTVIASIFLAAISNALTIYNVGPHAQLIIRGVILLVAFSINSIKILIEESSSRRRVRRNREA